MDVRALSPRLAHVPLGPFPSWSHCYHHDIYWTHFGARHHTKLGMNRDVPGATTEFTRSLISSSHILEPICMTVLLLQIGSLKGLNKETTRKKRVRILPWFVWFPKFFLNSVVLNPGYLQVLKHWCQDPYSKQMKQGEGEVGNLLPLKVIGRTSLMVSG